MIFITKSFVNISLAKYIISLRQILKLTSILGDRRARISWMTEMTQNLRRIMDRVYMCLRKCDYFYADNGNDRKWLLHTMELFMIFPRICSWVYQMRLYTYPTVVMVTKHIHIPVAAPEKHLLKSSLLQRSWKQISQIMNLKVWKWTTQYKNIIQQTKTFDKIVTWSMH